MIYWERVHPWFSVTFPQTENIFVWEWERPEGWVYWLDAGEVPQKSGPLAAMTVLLRERLRPINQLADFLVIYSETGDRCSVGLVATSVPSSLQSCGVVPPAWWFDEPTLLGTFLAQLKAKIEAIHHDVKMSRPLARESHRSSSTHCTECGLPFRKHVGHAVPGVKMPPSGLPASAYREYYGAFRKHYQSALQRLSDDEILGMEVPYSPRYLRVLALEIQRRIDNPTPVKGRYDLLLEEEGLLNPQPEAQLE